MKRIDTGRAANAYGGPAGGTGHFQDTDPTGGTQFDAEWCEAVQEALAETIEGLGGVLAGDETGQLWGLLGPRVQGQIAHATDTGSVSVAQNRVIVASVACQADALETACVASQDSIAHGVRSAVVASSEANATGAQSLAAASTGAIVSGAHSAALGVDGGGISAVEVSGNESILLASGAGELADDYTVGGCYGLPITPSGTNQNLKWILNSTTGAAHFAGNVKIGGDPDDGTGATLSIAAATGSVQMDGAFNQLSVDAGANKPSDTITGPTNLTLPWVQTVYNTAVGANSQIFVTFEDTTSPARQASVTVQIESRKANTSFTIRVTEQSGTFNPGTSLIHYWILNPA